MLGFSLALACPKGPEPVARILKEANRARRRSIVLIRDPFEAVEGADIIYTDVWASMGQEKERAGRKRESRNARIRPMAALDSGSRLALNTMRCRASLARNDDLSLRTKVLQKPQI